MSGHFYGTGRALATVFGIILVFSFSAGAELSFSQPGGHGKGRTAAGFVPVYHLLNLSRTSERITVTASSHENDGSGYHPPWHAYDSDYATRWSAYGRGEWLQFAFPAAVFLDGAAIAFHQGSQRRASFTIELSCFLTFCNRYPVKTPLPQGKWTVAIMSISSHVISCC